MLLGSPYFAFFNLCFSYPMLKINVDHTENDQLLGGMLCLCFCGQTKSYMRIRRHALEGKSLLHDVTREQRAVTWFGV